MEEVSEQSSSSGHIKFGSMNLGLKLGLANFHS